MSASTTIPQAGTRSPSVYYRRDPRLNDAAKVLYGHLLSLRKNRENREGQIRTFLCDATRTLAEALRKSVRAVQLALDTLISAGYLRREMVYSLRTRRRLIFTDLEPHLPGIEIGPQSNSLAQFLALSRARNCADFGGPPTPPYRRVWRQRD